MGVVSNTYFIAYMYIQCSRCLPEPIGIRFPGHVNKKNVSCKTLSLFSHLIMLLDNQVVCHRGIILYQNLLYFGYISKTYSIYEFQDNTHSIPA